MLRRRLTLLLCGVLACLSHVTQADEVAASPFTLFSRAGPIAMQLSLTPAQRLWIKGKGQLVLGTSAPDYPPFDMTASGRDYEGLTADFAG